MRKIVQYTLTSLDGAVEDPRRYFPDSATTAAGPRSSTRSRRTSRRR
jgi:hypothetical protein